MRLAQQEKQNARRTVRRAFRKSQQVESEPRPPQYIGKRFVNSVTFSRTLDSNQIPTAWTKQTSFRLETGLAPVEGTVAEYSWQISVVRVNRAETGELVLEAASPASEVRTFSWR